MSRYPFILALFAISIDAVACSFRRYEMFPPVLPWKISANNEKIEAPTVDFDVRRGGGRENDNSCADTGVVTFTIHANEYSELNTGYLIEVLESTEDEIVLPDHPLEAQGVDSVYSFPWLDGATKVQEPLRLSVRITQMESDGKKSKPVIIEVSHHGYL